MRERPGSRGSSASPALMAIYAVLVQPRTHTPNPVQLRHIQGKSSIIRIHHGISRARLSQLVLRHWVPLDILLGHHWRPDSGVHTATVLRLLRGESLELLARELGVTAAALSAWRDAFLAGGQAALKSRPADDRDEEIARLRAKVGELTTDNELLLQRCRADRPFAPTRRKP